MRRRYRQNPKTLEMELVSDNTVRERGILICPDIEPFKSSIDGSTISGRAALRNHNKRHDVTNPADFTNHWQQTARERERMYTGDPSFDRKRRTEAVRQAVEKHEQRRR